MNKRLRLAVLAQAVLDLIDGDRADDVSDDDIESALVFLSSYPKLLRRLRTIKDRKKWAAEIEAAMGRQNKNG